MSPGLELWVRYARYTGTRCGKTKAFWIVLIVLVLLGGGGYAAYARGLIPGFAPQEAAVEETTLETATVTVGDLSITADGTGQLVASSQTELAFDAGGTAHSALLRGAAQSATCGPFPRLARLHRRKRVAQRAP